MLDGERFGGQFAKDNKKKGEQDKGSRQGDAVGQIRVGLQANQVHDLKNEFGYNRLPDPAQAQRSQGNAELDRRQGGIQVGDEVLAHLGRSAAGLNQEFDLGRTNLDDCKLCRDEKGVDQDQQECDEQTEGGTLHACASHLPAGWGKPQLSL